MRWQGAEATPFASSHLPLTRSRLPPPFDRAAGVPQSDSAACNATHHRWPRTTDTLESSQRWGPRTAQQCKNRPQPITGSGQPKQCAVRDAHTKSLSAPTTAHYRLGRQQRARSSKPTINNHSAGNAYSIYRNRTSTATMDNYRNSSNPLSSA